MQTSPLATGAMVALTMLAASPALAQNKYGPGVSDTEIVLGNTMAYSGPASAWGEIGRSMSAYFDKVNAEGGVNGRKIRLISLDDGYSPPKTVEQVRRLVEEDKVLASVGNLGTAANSAVYRYLNQRKVPHLFIISGIERWADPQNFPWTIGFIPTYTAEGKVVARYILNEVKDPKIAVLYQNDDSGKESLAGLKQGLGAQAKLVVAEASFETQDPSVDSQVVSLAASNANVLMLWGTAKASAQALRKAHDIGWHPLRIIGSPAASVSATLEPAGLDKSVGVISAAFVKDPTDQRWENDPDFKEYLAWLKQYNPKADVTAMHPALGYSVAQLMTHVLKQCGNDLTRENVLKQAQNLSNVQLPMLLPGITINTRPDNYHTMEGLQLQRFNGKRWELFGSVIKG